MENGHLRQMGTRKNEHQGKWALGENGYFGTDGHWGKWALGKWAPGKTSTRANGLWAIGVNEQFGQMGV